jgi:hypothetical protein
MERHALYIPLAAVVVVVFVYLKHLVLHKNGPMKCGVKAVVAVVGVAVIILHMAEVVDSMGLPANLVVPRIT